MFVPQTHPGRELVLGFHKGKYKGCCPRPTCNLAPVVLLMLPAANPLAETHKAGQEPSAGSRLNRLRGLASRCFAPVPAPSTSPPRIQVGLTLRAVRFPVLASVATDRNATIWRARSRPHRPWPAREARPHPATRETPLLLLRRARDERHFSQSVSRENHENTRVFASAVRAPRKVTADADLLLSCCSPLPQNARTVRRRRHVRRVPGPDVPPGEGHRPRQHLPGG